MVRVRYGWRIEKDAGALVDWRQEREHEGGEEESDQQRRRYQGKNIRRSSSSSISPG